MSKMKEEAVKESEGHDLCPHCKPKGACQGDQSKSSEAESEVECETEEVK